MIVSPENITLQFLYGDVSAAPALLTSRLRDTPPDTVPISIDVNVYLNSYIGKYVVAARSVYVQEFFSGFEDLPAGRYTVGDIIQSTGAGVFKFTQEQARLDLGANNYIERAYIFGHEVFNIGLSTVA